MDKNLKVMIVSSEVSPYAKSGGLGDVAGALPKELFRQGADARVVLPKYKTIPRELIADAEYIGCFDVTLGWRRQSASVFVKHAPCPVYFIENDYYFGREGFYGYGDDFERFAFFSKAALGLLNLIDFKVDVIHANDWQTGLLPVFLRDFYSKFVFYSNMKTLFTIHNLQYQGIFGKEILTSADLNPGYGNLDKLEYNGNISYMKAGIIYADAVNTVSATYVREIQSQAFGYGMDGVLRSVADRLYGITNGIDGEVYDPAGDPKIFSNFDAYSLDLKYVNKAKLQEQLGLPVRDVPLFGIISRLVDQKGLDLVGGIMDELMARDVQLVVLGIGDGKYEHMFRHLSRRFPEKLSANIYFDDTLAHRIYAGSDMFIMPSLFEPCGLGQMVAMRYGCVPIVRETGGLADTVSHYSRETKRGNGFVFRDYLLSGLMWAVNEALALYRDPPAWRRVVKNAMEADNSWERSAAEYIELYRKISGKHE